MLVKPFSFIAAVTACVNFKTGLLDTEQLPLAHVVLLLLSDARLTLQNRLCQAIILLDCCPVFHWIPQIRHRCL
jgi:hypothetical protein